MRKIFSTAVFFIAMVGMALPSHSQFIYTVAGGGTGGLGDGGPADSAELYYPQGVAVDAAGDIYIADTYHHRIRMVTAGTNIITTIAGTGTGGFGGDSGMAIAAKINSPEAVALDPAGNLYIADYGNQRIRKVAAGTGIITTIAGTGTGGYNGDNIHADSAKLDFPNGLATDSAGDLYIGDSGNQRVRRIDALTGIITTVAGGGTVNPGDSGQATAAELFQPQGIAIGPGGVLYIADGVANRVRQVDPLTHIITTIAGTGMAGYNLDGVPATTADLNIPYGLLIQDTTLYIADSHNNRIRAVGLPAGYISTVTGDGSPAYGGDGGYAYNGEVNDPTALAQDAAGNIYIADLVNDRIRIISQNALGISGISASDHISLYPNPSAGTFMLTTSGCIGREYTVYDMVGSVITQQAISSDRQPVYMRGIAPGTYLLSVVGAKPIKLVVESRE